MFSVTEREHRTKFEADVPNVLCRCPMTNGPAGEIANPNNKRSENYEKIILPLA